MEIYLIRHTEVKGSKTICYGQSNPPLADTFLEEAAAIKAKLSTDFDAIYSSPLLRCKLLAEKLGYQNIQIVEALMEVNFGTWEGIPWNEIPQTELDPWMADFVNAAPPLGESLLNMYQRISGFTESLRTQPHKKVLIIAHAGVIRNIFSYILNIPLANIFNISVSYGEIFRIKLAKQAISDKVFLNIT
jgi:alpha-ribazole phosphatase